RPARGLARRLLADLWTAARNDSAGPAVAARSISPAADARNRAAADHRRHSTGPEGSKRAGKGGGCGRADTHRIGRAAGAGGGTAVQYRRLPGVGIGGSGHGGDADGPDPVPGLLPTRLWRSVPAQAGEDCRTVPDEEEDYGADPQRHRSADRNLPAGPV